MKEVIEHLERMAETLDGVTEDNWADTPADIASIYRSVADEIRRKSVVVAKMETTTSTCKDSLQVGDIAAMREALELARDLILPQCNGGTGFAKACGETVNKIMNALAKPPRNCDLFGGDPKKLHELWWEWSGDLKNCNADGTVKLTYGEWLLVSAKGGAHANR